MSVVRTAWVILTLTCACSAPAVTIIWDIYPRWADVGIAAMVGFSLWIIILSDFIRGEK